MQFDMLQPEDIDQIHQSTLRVLEEVGISIDDPQAIEILTDNGAFWNGERLCLPARLVEDSLEHCPPQVVLKGREGEITLGDGTLHVHNLGGARDVFDITTGMLRPAGRQDNAESTRLMDDLPNVTSITPLYTPRDVHSSQMVLAMFVDMARNTLKPLNGPGVRSASEVGLLAEMAQVVLGGVSQFSLGASPVSPLNFNGEIGGTIIEIARRGIVFGPLPCPSVGATSPMSLAGSLVLQNAEALACIVLAELVHPGLPVVYCGRLSVLNMRSGAPVWGNPEIGIVSAGTVAIGHKYGLPVNVYGLANSGYSPDIQSGYERATNALVPALAGADELSGVGEMAGGIYSSHEQIVIDDDIYGIVRRVMRGFAVDEDSLAVEVIKHAMAHSRNFMMEKHTRRYLRSGELWQARLGVEDATWESWVGSGQPGVLQRAQAEAKRILDTHTVPPLPAEIDRELERILALAARELADL